MEYKISDQEIAKRKRSPFLILSPFLIVILVLIFSNTSNDSNLSELIFILSAVGILSTGSNAFSSYRFVKDAKKHKLIVSLKGIVFFNDRVETLIPWEKIVSLDSGGKSINIKKLIMKTDSSKKIDLSHYENLQELYQELRQHVHVLQSL